jgi:two-component system chemotaxis response regulator CheY
MLVDDDKNLQRVYEVLFVLNGLKITSQAFDGVQAVDLYPQLNPKPDVIIMDQRMPRMDGVTATIKIKQIDPDAKVIFLSADDTAREKAMNSGARLFLTKPISIDTLLESIKKVVNE